MRVPSFGSFRLQTQLQQNVHQALSPLINTAWPSIYTFNQSVTRTIAIAIGLSNRGLIRLNTI